MKNVLLIGDSIRIGYGRAVKSTLEGKANVYYPDDNCRFASYVLRYIEEYKWIVPEGKVDVLHWNTGLWDCLRLYEEDPHTPLDFYAYYIERICKRIKNHYPDTTVIFATSTSVQSERMLKDFKRYNEEIEAYNETAVAIVKKYGFAVNDLYALSASLPDEAHSDPVHYNTPAATRAFTDQIVASIAPALGITEAIPYKEALFVGKPSGI